MLDASRGCRVRTMVVIDEVPVGSAFNENFRGGGGGVLSSASRVMVAAQPLRARGSEAQRRSCPSRLLPPCWETRRVDELILGISCVSILHIRCRDFCALIIDAGRSRRKLLGFCKVRGVLGSSYAARTACPHPGVSVPSPKADCLLPCSEDNQR